jgi:Ca2+-binding RTX toxin-like protein
LHKILEWDDEQLSNTAIVQSDFVRPSLSASTVAGITKIDNIYVAGQTSSHALIEGTSFNDKLTGTNDRDKILGFGGQDSILGGNGDDTISGGESQDTIDGGAGSDTADYAEKTAAVTVRLNGSRWVDVRVGNVREDRIKNIENVTGGSGNDALTGDQFKNVLTGGAGNDLLDGKAGGDELRGGQGDDTYVIDNLSDQVFELVNEGTDLIRTALTHFDLIDYEHVENLTYTGRANSTLIGSDVDNVIRGGSRNDVIEGGAGSDSLYGGDGADLLFGYYDYDDSEINGGDPAFSDAAFEHERNNSIDRLYGGRGNDVYLFDQFVNTPEVIEYRGEGTDTILGSGAAYVLTDNVENYVNDTSLTDNDGNYLYVEITGNSLNNIMRSSPNWDLIPDTAGLDWLASNMNRLLSSTSNFQSNEKFFGMAGMDTLLGGAGDDYLSGGEGRDRLTGGSGADQFVFDAALNRNINVDTITDFISGQDTIVLDSAMFSRFSAGEDITDHFSATGRPLDSDDYLIYSATNKVLYYDADGNGNGAAVAFAVLTGVSMLNATDFLIM